MDDSDDEHHNDNLQTPLCNVATPCHQPVHWDVFLCHAGEQKGTIVAQLFEEFKREHPLVRVFMDKKSLQLGGHAPQDMSDALADCAVAVVVISKDSVVKKHPMEELLRLLKRWSNGDVILVPLLYQLDFETASNLLGFYKDKNLLPSSLATDSSDAAQNADDTNNFRDQQQHIGAVQGAAAAEMTKYQSWAAAVGQVLKITSLLQEKGVTDPQIVKKIVNAVVNSLKEKRCYLAPAEPVDLPRTLVGVETEAAAVIRKLIRHRIVLVHGMGGVGKSTLCKFVYNHLQPGHFQGEVSFWMRLPDNIPDDAYWTYQLKLVWGILKLTQADGYEGGHEAMKHALRGHKVLLLLDNVKDATQLTKILPLDIMSALGAGSLLLVNSRDNRVVQDFELEGGRRPEAYEMLPLSRARAMELFCKHAYGPGGGPSEDDEKVTVEKLVDWCNGLPVALEVCGKHFKQDRISWVHRWEATIRQACIDHAIPDAQYKNLFSVYETSYSMLDGILKLLLLDVGLHLNRRAWHAVAGYSDGVLEQLAVLGLVRREEDADGGCIVSMHDTIVEFCRHMERRQQASCPATAADRQPLRYLVGEETCAALIEQGICLKQECLAQPAHGLAVEDTQVQLPDMDDIPSSLRSLLVANALVYQPSKPVQLSQLRWLSVELRHLPSSSMQRHRLLPKLRTYVTAVADALDAASSGDANDKLQHASLYCDLYERLLVLAVEMREAGPGLKDIVDAVEAALHRAHVPIELLALLGQDLRAPGLDKWLVEQVMGNADNLKTEWLDKVDQVEELLGSIAQQHGIDHDIVAVNNKDVKLQVVLDNAKARLRRGWEVQLEALWEGEPAPFDQWHGAENGVALGYAAQMVRNVHQSWQGYVAELGGARPGAILPPDSPGSPPPAMSDVPLLRNADGPPSDASEAEPPISSGALPADAVAPAASTVQAQVSRPRQPGRVAQLLWLLATMLAQLVLRMWSGVCALLPRAQRAPVAAAVLHSSDSSQQQEPAPGSGNSYQQLQSMTRNEGSLQEQWLEADQDGGRQLQSGSDGNGSQQQLESDSDGHGSQQQLEPTEVEVVGAAVGQLVGDVHNALQRLTAGHSGSDWLHRRHEGLALLRAKLDNMAEPGQVLHAELQQLLQSTSSLRVLHLVNCPAPAEDEEGVRRMLLQGLSDLRHAAIFNMVELKEAVVGNLKALQHLHFQDCHDLGSLGFRTPLHQLATFSIQACPNVATVAGLKHQTNLARLNVHQVLQLKCITGGASLSSLVAISLSDCPALRELPGPALNTSLTFLKVFNCAQLHLIINAPKLKHLVVDSSCPAHLTSLDLSLLPSLTHLTLHSTPLLGSLPGLTSLRRLHHLQLTCPENLRPPLPDPATAHHLHHPPLAPCLRPHHFPALAHLELEGMGIPPPAILHQFPILRVLHSCDLPTKVLATSRVTAHETPTITLQGLPCQPQAVYLPHTRNTRRLVCTGCTDPSTSVLYDSFTKSLSPWPQSLTCLEFHDCALAPDLSFGPPPHRPPTTSSVPEFQSVPVQLPFLPTSPLVTSTAAASAPRLLPTASSPGCLPPSLRASQHLASRVSLSTMTSPEHHISSASLSSNPQDTPHTFQARPSPSASATLPSPPPPPPPPPALFLQQITLTDCSGITHLGGSSGLAPLAHLQLLEIRNCPDLIQIADISPLTSLTRLLIHGCQRLRNLPAEGSMPRLCSLQLVDVALSQMLGAQALAHYDHVDVQCGSGRVVEVVAGIHGAEAALAADSTSVAAAAAASSTTTTNNNNNSTTAATTTASTIATATSSGSSTTSASAPVSLTTTSTTDPTASTILLPRLRVWSAQLPRHLPPSPLQHLCCLEIEGGSLRCIPHLESLTRLQSLTIKYLPALQHLPNLSMLSAVQSLVLLECPRVSELPGLGATRALTELRLAGVGIEVLEDLSSLRELQLVLLERCGSLRELPAVREGAQVEAWQCSWLPQP